MTNGIGFSIPDVTVYVEETEIPPLIDELHKIGDGAPRLHAAIELAESLQSLIESHKPVVDPTDRERYALVRATNHLTRGGQHSGLIELRDDLYGTGNAAWLSYRLTFLDEPARPAEDFTGYALNYEPGDRLVTPAGDELRVRATDFGTPATLDVVPWRPNQPYQVPTFVFEHSTTRPFVSIPPQDALAIVAELTRRDDDSGHAAAQKIVAAMDLGSGTDITLNIFENAAVLAALDTLMARNDFHGDTEALHRELRARQP
jgi:hypothetical protein